MKYKVGDDVTDRTELLSKFLLEEKKPSSWIKEIIIILSIVAVSIFSFWVGMVTANINIVLQ